MRSVHTYEGDQSRRAVGPGLDSTSDLVPALLIEPKRSVLECGDAPDQCRSGRSTSSAVLSMRIALKAACLSPPPVYSGYSTSSRVAISAPLRRAFT